MLLQQNTFTVTYNKGSDNIVADFFSRNPNGSFNDDHVNDKRMLVSRLKWGLPSPTEDVEGDALVFVCRLEGDEYLKQLARDIGRIQSENRDVRRLVDRMDPDQCQEYHGIIFYTR